MWVCKTPSSGIHHTRFSPLCVQGAALAQLSSASHVMSGCQSRQLSGPPKLPWVALCTQCITLAQEMEVVLQGYWRSARPHSPHRLQTLKSAIRMPTTTTQRKTGVSQETLYHQSLPSCHVLHVQGHNYHTSSPTAQLRNTHG